MKKLVKSLLLLVVVSAMTMTIGCSKKTAAATGSSEVLGYADVELGKTYTDVKATIKMLTCRTDMCKPDYPGVNYDAYLAEFNKMYPNIKVEIPIGANDNKWPAAYAAFTENGVELVVDNPAPAGEEDLFGNLNSESELAINAGGNLKVQQIIEHAANGTKSFDDIMAEWNAAWTTAQTSEGSEIKY